MHDREEGSADGARQSAFGCRRLAGLAVGLLAALGGVQARAGDDVIELRLDTADYALESIDRRGGDAGPRIGVALGSPSASTPEGRFTLSVVVLNPAWNPGRNARDSGAKPEPASRWSVTA